LGADDAIEEALLRVVEPGAIAAVEAEAQAASRRDQVRDALVRGGALQRRSGIPAV
jgi:hypothetical protein